MRKLRTYNIPVSLCDAADPDTPVRDRICFQIPFNERDGEPPLDETIAAFAHAISDACLPVSDIDPETISYADSDYDGLLRIAYIGNDTNLAVALAAHNCKTNRYDIETYTGAPPIRTHHCLAAIDNDEIPAFDAVILDWPARSEKESERVKQLATIHERFDDNTLFIVSIDNIAEHRDAAEIAAYLDAATADAAFVRLYEPREHRLHYDIHPHMGPHRHHHDSKALASALLERICDIKIDVDNMN